MARTRKRTVTPVPPLEQWLAQGSAVVSGRLFKSLEGDPAAREVRRLAPDLAVLLLTPERVAALRAEFADDLVLERDAALKPLG